MQTKEEGLPDISILAIDLVSLNSCLTCLKTINYQVFRTNINGPNGPVAAIQKNGRDQGNCTQRFGSFEMFGAFLALFCLL